MLGKSLRSKVMASVGEFLDNNLLARCFTKNYVLTRQDLNDNFRKNPRFDYMYNPCSFQSMEYIGNKKKIVLAVGRIVEEKNFGELLEIWQLIHPSNRDWKLRIVGSGSSEQMLKEKAAKLGIAESVDFAGYSEKIDEEMMQASIYAMTSLYEGLPLVLLEAQNAGMPCVSYNLPYGPADILHDKVDGFLVENRNKEQFAERLCALMNDEDMRQTMGRHAIQNARRFSTDVIISQWMEKYNELLQRTQ